MKSTALFFFAAFCAVITSCSGDQPGYSMGTTFWQIDIPSSYVDHLKHPDTLKLNTICGTPIDGEMIQLFELQYKDTVWVDPIPNVFAAFHASKDFLKNSSLKDCVDETTAMYAYFFEMSNVNYEDKQENITIDGVPFIQLENEIFDAQGRFSHGDVHYFGELADRILHIQISYNSKKEKKRMVKAVVDSHFDLYH